MIYFFQDTPFLILNLLFNWFNLIFLSRYMKCYKILDQAKIDIQLLPYISKIFYVVGGLVNLQSVKMSELIEHHDYQVNIVYSVMTPQILRVFTSKVVIIQYT